MYFEQIAEIIAEKFDIDVNDVKLTTNIFEDLGADSLDIVDAGRQIQHFYSRRNRSGNENYRRRCKLHRRKR